MSWIVVFTKQARNDAKKLSASGLKSKADAVIEILGQNPYQVPPTYGQLVGDLASVYSRRINIQHRIVYQILDDEETVKVIRMWTHYE